MADTLGSAITLHYKVTRAARSVKRRFRPLIFVRKGQRPDSYQPGPTAQVWPCVSATKGQRPAPCFNPTQTNRRTQTRKTIVYVENRVRDYGDDGLGDWSGLQPSINCWTTLSWGVAPGWYEAHLWFCKGEPFRTTNGIV